MWKINNPITEKYLYYFFSQTYIDQQCEEAVKEKSQYVHFDNGSNICNIQFHVLLKEFEKSIMMKMHGIVILQFILLKLVFIW